VGGGFGSPQLDFKVKAIFELGRSLRLAAVIAKIRIKGDFRRGGANASLLGKLFDTTSRGCGG
jgi:hypothetical protein